MNYILVLRLGQQPAMPRTEFPFNENDHISTLQNGRIFGYKDDESYIVSLFTKDNLMYFIIKKECKHDGLTFGYAIAMIEGNKLFTTFTRIFKRNNYRAYNSHGLCGYLLDCPFTFEDDESTTRDGKHFETLFGNMKMEFISFENIKGLDICFLRNLLREQVSKEHYERIALEMLVLAVRRKEVHLRGWLLSKVNTISFQKLGFLYEYAVINHDMNTMKFLHKKGIPFTEDTCGNACYFNSLECLKFARANGAKWTDYERSTGVLNSTLAIRNNNLEMVKYLFEAGVKFKKCFSDWGTHISTYFGWDNSLPYETYEPMLEFLYSIGFTCDNYLLYNCIQRGYKDPSEQEKVLKTLKFFHDRGYIYHERDYSWKAQYWDSLDGAIRYWDPLYFTRGPIRDDPFLQKCAQYMDAHSHSCDQPMCQMERGETFINYKKIPIMLQPYYYEKFLPKRFAGLRIVRQLEKCALDPQYAYCRRRLLRNFEELKKEGGFK